MQFRTVLSLATFFLLCFTVSVWSMPVDTHPSFSGSASANSTVTGKISAVGDASFTVEVKQSQNADAMQFLVDDKTKVEGKLTVGAQATVEYRSDQDKNIAVRVVVTPTSGMTPQ